MRPPHTLRQVSCLANLRKTRRTRARRGAPALAPPPSSTDLTHDRLRSEIREGQEGAEI